LDIYQADGEKQPEGLIRMVAKSIIKKKVGVENKVRLPLEEEILRQYQENLSVYVENAPEGIYFTDLKGTFLYGNKKAEEIIGYSREELIGKSFLKLNLLPKEYLVKAVNLLAVNAMGKPTGPEEFELIRKDGSQVCVEISTTLIQQGKEMVVSGCVYDITEHKQVEESLRQSEEKYRTILEDMEDDYFEVDLAGNLTSVNNSTCRSLGYSKEELIGMSYRVFTAKEDAETVYQAFNQVYQTGKPVRGLSWKIVRKDGSVGVAEAAVFSLRNQEGEIIGFRGVGRDITERKQAEEALRQSEEKYRTILDDMGDGYFELDLAGNITFFNDSLCRLLGYPKEELKGMNYKAFTPEENVEAMYKIFTQVYRMGKPLEQVQAELIRKDGSRRFSEVSASLLRNQKGDIIGFRGIHRDVTERREAEQQLLTASKLASVGELAAGVAHELNNPLTGIMGYAQLLSDRQDVPQDIKKNLDRIYYESQRSARIVQNLLSFARRHEPQKTYFNLNELIEKTLELRSYELRTSNIGVYANLAPSLPQILADYNQIQQVVLNILINAKQAIDQTKHRGKISVTTSTGEDNVTISIADNGSGISKDKSDRIFDPFFTTKEVGSGTGLGLSICLGIITQHGGKIYVESQKGKGANFSIELPLAAQGQAIVEEEVVVAENQSSRLKATGHILIVDDEPVICDVLARALSEKGYTTVSVSDGRTALEKIAENSCALCIIDLKMPQMSGEKLYEIMKRRYPSSAERVVFITGNTVTSATENFLNSTGKPYLIKPFNSNQLVELVEETLGG